ncbi:MAG: protoporphyrinogen oxidase, partial [Planctomycetia bacterium]
MEDLPLRFAAVLAERGVTFVPAAAGPLGRDGAGRWRVPLVGVPQPLEADAVVVAVPATAAARLVAEVDVALAAELAAIEYAG